jgi:hypothetical protein
MDLKLLNPLNRFKPLALWPWGPCASPLTPLSWALHATMPRTGPCPPLAGPCRPLAARRSGPGPPPLSSVWCRPRQTVSPPSVPCHTRPPHLTPTRPKASPPFVDAIRSPPSTGNGFPPNKIGRSAVVSPVSGEGCHHAGVFPFPSAWLAPHLPLHLCDLQGQRRITASHHEPSSDVGMPPCRSLSATSPMSDLLGEPRRHSSCPAYSSHRPRARATDRATRGPSANPGRPRHHANFGYNDCAPLCPRACRALCTVGPPQRSGQAARWATVLWRPTAIVGCQPTPRRGLRPKAGPQARNDFPFPKFQK